MRLGALLKKLRLEKHFTIESLARAVDCNINVIYAIESGRTVSPRVATLEKILKGLGVSLSEFFLKLEYYRLAKPKEKE